MQQFNAKNLVCERLYIALSILVLFPSSFFSMCFVSIHEVHPYNSMDTLTPWKKSHFILSDRSDFSMLTSLSVDEMLLPRYVNLSTNFRGLLFKVEMLPSHLKHELCFISVQCLLLLPLGYVVGIWLGLAYF